MLFVTAFFIFLPVNDLASGFVHGGRRDGKFNTCSFSTDPFLLYATSTDINIESNVGVDCVDYDIPTTARAAEANKFRIELDEAGLSRCHGILHSLGCRSFSDIRHLTPSQVTSMGLDDSDGSIIGDIRDDNTGHYTNCQSSRVVNHLSTIIDGLPFATNNEYNFEVICDDNDIFKGQLLSPDQCNQLKRMSENHAYQINPDWMGMSCRSIPDYISTTEDTFSNLFVEIQRSLFPATMRERTIQFESANEPHLVRYNGEAKGAPLHTDNAHKSLTMNVLLSDPDDFGGGGTYIKAIDRTIKLKQGEMLIHPGNLEHAGADITFGVRHLLVAFLECEWH